MALGSQSLSFKIFTALCITLLVGCGEQSPVVVINNGITRLEYNGYYYSTDPDNNYHWFNSAGVQVPNEPLGHWLSDYWRNNWNGTSPPSTEGQLVINEFNKITPEEE